MREWRNWFTRTFEGGVGESPWEFESPLAHLTRLRLPCCDNCKAFKDPKLGYKEPRATSNEIYD